MFARNSPLKLFFGGESDPGSAALTDAAAGAPMAVTEVGVYRGPHYFSHTPMILSAGDGFDLKLRKPLPPRR